MAGRSLLILSLIGLALPGAFATDSLLTMRPVNPAQEEADAPTEGAPADDMPMPDESMSLAMGRSERATYLLGNAPWHNDPEILWPGLLTGMRGFEHFYEPVGNPLYFESPFINTQLRFLYLHHRFPNGSQLGGGDVNVYALQARIALTERLAFIATKDGYSDLNARALPADEGWNDIAAGFKYAFIADRENDFILTGGVRWELSNGHSGILQGNDDELSPFVSFAKGWDRFHMLGNITGRLPMDRNKGNYILQWDLHFDYEIAPETLPGFAPLIEFHGLHYLSDGDAFPLSVGAYDYSNIGSSDVSGDGVVSMGAGFRWKLNPHVSIGSTYAFPLHNQDNDIMGGRFTADIALTW